MVPVADNIYKHIGRRVREERTRRRWTQEQLAEKVELHLSFIGQLERGINKPSLLTINKLADAFGIRAGDLFDESILPTKHQPETKIVNFLRCYSRQQQDVLFESLRLLARQFKKFPKK